MIKKFKTVEVVITVLSAVISIAIIAKIISMKIDNFKDEYEITYNNPASVHIYTFNKKMVSFSTDYKNGKTSIEQVKVNESKILVVTSTGAYEYENYRSFYISKGLDEQYEISKEGK